MKNTIIENTIKEGNNLEHYFSLARNMEPVTRVDEVEKLFQNASQGAKGISRHKNKSKLTYKILLFGSIILITIIFATHFLNVPKDRSSYTKHYKFIVNQPIAHGKITKIETRKTEKAASLSQREQKHLPQKAPINPITPFQILFPQKGLNGFQDKLLASPIVDRKSNHAYLSGEHGNKPNSDNPFSLLSGIKPLDLDRAHLALMGISPDVKYLDYKANIPHLGTIRYYNNDTTVELGVNDKLIIFGKTLDFYPAFITDSNGESPDAGSSFGAINTDSFLHLQSNRWPGYSNYDVDFTLIPVLLKQSDYNGFQGHKNIIFWFIVTPKLKEILSDLKRELPIVLTNRYEYAYRHSHPMATEIPPYKPEPNLIGHLSFKRIKPLALTDNQLRRLGFTITLEKTSYHCYVKGLGSFRYFSDAGGERTRFDGSRPKSDTGQDFCPVYISDLKGKQQFVIKHFVNRWIDKNSVSYINTLVPVIVKGNGLRLYKKQDLIFWFNVTPSFLASLPDTVAMEMGKEYRKFMDLKNGDSDMDMASVQHCKYFDLCQLSLENKYGMKVYPNPATDTINIEFGPPKNDGTVYASIILTDYNGNILQKDDLPWYGRTASIMVNDRKPGIYFVVLKLNTGEIISNKILIMKD